MGMSLALISGFQWKKRSSKVMRRERRRRGDDLVAPEIPWDLMIEILTRFPGKSLMRFKCVSKLWSSLIRCRYFSNRYLTVPRPPRMYVSWVEHLQCDSLELCHNPGKSVLLSLSSSSATSFDQDLTMPGMGGHNMVVLRGLILYTVCRKACVYNPATRQSVTLPAVKSNIFAQQQGLEKHVFYFLGHDPVLDQYKVVCNVVICSDDLQTLISEHWVFVLEAGGSWKRIESDQPHVVPTRLGLCINGIIYYLACPYMSCDILVSFDVMSEELSMIQAPHEMSSDFGGFLGFIEYGGKPTVFDHTHLAPQGLVDLWVLEDGGKWCKKSLALQACQMHLVNNDTGFVVQGTTQNGEVIFAPRPMVSPSYFLYYNLQKNDLRKVDIRGIWDHWFGTSYFYSTLMDQSESIVHLET